MKNGIIYYTDNRDAEPIISICRKTLSMSANLPIVSCSLKPIEFGKNVVLENAVRSYPTMVRQIILALETLECQNAYFCEHDVLYHPSHFDFSPDASDVFYYNINNWRWDYPSDRLIHYSGLTSLSMMCCNREFALDHFRRRLEHILALGWAEDRSREPRWARRMGYEPGTKKTKNGGFSDDKMEIRRSAFPNIDIRHDKTFSKPKVNLRSFKHKPTDWVETNIDGIPYWNLREMFSL